MATPGVKGEGLVRSSPAIAIVNDAARQEQLVIIVTWELVGLLFNNAEYLLSILRGRLLIESAELS